ncbi:NAD(P)H-hydrate dehydratase [Pedobacter aquatilis]|uniref:NAD(P)H-hydrate dehydratase n=1 Tax=Pedobacter aquatilis TaxID=351343 RepID=UPI0025B2B1F2|nr:NAD(P)H-hydrate dehydratase [Pedobacter aquatilis]MDN3586950.1 NAD(P)H-hydrate dehydratase [Pedobacter aquatilis]
MQTLLTSTQMHDVDKFTIINTPIASIDLMENAARAFTHCLLKEEFDIHKSIAIFCGKGNNGGDGLAIAHVLLQNGYQNIKIYIVDFSEKESVDFTINLQRIEESKCKKFILSKSSSLKNISSDIIIDAILGSGLNRELSGDYLELVSKINSSNKKIYAVDIPTGFFSEGKLPDTYFGIKAYKTICFERPKINFFFPESSPATEKFEVVNIGLNQEYLQNQESDFYLIEYEDIQRTIKPRKLFSHKGTYGHALIVAGNNKTMGAALLASKACLYSGAGLTTACSPNAGLIALNTAMPEVMAVEREEITSVESIASYNSIAIGPGLGISEENEEFLEKLISFNKSLIIDADALNILSKRQDLLAKIPVNSILTPHIKEFDRIFGIHKSWWDRVATAKIQAQKLNVIIVLKNQFTFICTPKGKVYINPTGNPAMAQGGMGDVLTGIIAAFVAQKYNAFDSALLACYLHGKAGDSLATEKAVVTASEVAERIAFELKAALTG